jgi:hypothetical protein
MWTIRPVGVILAATGNRAPRAPEPSRARVSPNQCRQARDILKWTPSGLAGAADVAPEVISAFEEGREVSPGHEEAIRTALEAVGIGFPFEIANGRARPAGVTYSPRDRKEGH